MLGRWGGPGETAGDWRRVTDLVALSIAAAWLAGGPVDKRLVRSLQELHLQVDIAVAMPLTVIFGYNCVC